MFKQLGDFFFRHRSYTPIPFLLIMLIFASPTFNSIVIGFTLALIGESIRIWSVSYAGSETRTTEKAGGTFLVTQGPYSYVRNPLYIGNIFMYIGIGIMSNALFPYLQILAFLYFAFQYYCIILSEEHFLKQKFTNSYNQYLKIVSRFIPFKKNIPQEIKSNLDFNSAAGFRSEKRSLQALFITSFIILIFYITKFRILG